MNTQERFYRCSTGVSQEKLASRFGLYWENKMQDWDLVVSDFGRIPEFLKVYQNELKNKEDKFALMELIVSSLDDGISNFDKETENSWNICKIILEKECFLHYSTIIRWSQIDENDIKNTFEITPYMRDIWRNVEMNFL